MSSANHPTRIYPNPSAKIVSRSIHDVIELELINVVEKILYTKVTDKDLDLAASSVDLVEILMDLEELFRPHFFKADGTSKIDDDDFINCKTFNEMIQHIRERV